MTRLQADDVPSTEADDGFVLDAVGTASTFTVSESEAGVRVHCRWLLDAATDEWFDFTTSLPGADLKSMRSQYGNRGVVTLTTEPHQVQVRRCSGETNRASVEMSVLGHVPRSLWLHEVPGLHEYLDVR